VNGVELEAATRVYGEGHTAVSALSGVTLTVTSGELAAVMGPSGSGKSTLLNLIGGLDQPTSGRVTVNGADLASLSPAALARLRRRDVGFVFQQHNLLPQLSAVENVSLSLELDGVRVREARRKAATALDALGVAELAARFPDELSGGEQQRIAIARAIVADRPVILADEPTAALDSIDGEIVVRLLRRYAEDGAAVVMVSHDPRWAAWAHNIVTLSDGRIEDESPPVAGTVAPAVR
jgi:putative ABC transport system ATP-binding protein